GWVDGNVDAVVRDHDIAGDQPVGETAVGYRFAGQVAENGGADDDRGALGGGAGLPRPHLMDEVVAQFCAAAVREMDGRAPRSHELQVVDRDPWAGDRRRHLRWERRVERPLSATDDRYRGAMYVDLTADVDVVLDDYTAVIAEIEASPEDNEAAAVHGRLHRRQVDGRVIRAHNHALCVGEKRCQDE